MDGGGRPTGGRTGGAGARNGGAGRRSGGPGGRTGTGTGLCGVETSSGFKRVLLLDVSSPRRGVYSTLSRGLSPYVHTHTRGHAHPVCNKNTEILA